MSSYWADRFLSEEERRDKDNRRYYSTIEKEYNKALAGLEKDIEYWLGRIAKNNDISLSGAKELLSKKELQEFKWTVEEYIQRGKENEVSGQWLKQLENASARVHIQRLEALKIQIQDRIENMYTTRDRSMEDYLCRVYKDTYYHTVFEIDKGVGSIQSSFNKLDDRKVLQIIHKPWAVDGKDFSTRIWEDKDNLVNTLHTGLTQAFIRGGNLDDVVNDISQFVSSKIKNKKYVASRLVTTESAAYASKAQEQAYKDLSVDKYEILATLDLHTSDICQDLDGKIFDRKDYQVGVTAPPFHPNCRTVTVPWFPDDVDTGERAARGKDGKVGYVPQNMTYKEWYNKYVEQKFKEDGIIELDSSSKPTSILQLENWSDLESYLKNNYNININNEVKNINFEIGKQALHGIEVMLNEFPELKNQIKTLELSKMGVMSCGNGKITFNPKEFSNADKLLETCLEMDKTHHWIKNVSPASIGVHEATHALEEVLIENNPEYFHKLLKVSAWNNCTEAKKIISQAVKNIKKTPYGKGKNKSDLIYDISAYARHNDSEAMAEAFADVYANGENANPLSKEIKKIAKELLNSYKKGE